MRLLFWAGAQRLLPLLLLLAVLQVSANPQPKERHYYIAAVEIDWNYSGDVSDRFNTTYKKVVFREYEKGFQQAKTHPSWLGLLGPTLRAEQGETIVVTFRNMASRPHSIHPHGVAYGKQSEGAPYFDNTSLKEKEDDLVQPGCEHVYYWEVTPEVSPQPHDPTCLTHMYISHRNVVEEYNAGLIGALLVCKHSSLDARGQQKSVAQEMVFLFGIFDEKVSEMEPKGLSLDNHVKYTINGYAKGTLPGIVLCAHSFISLHLMGMSSEPELFSVHLNGQVLQQTGSKVSSVGLISGSTATASVVPAHTGRWLMSSFIAKHMEVGMHAFVDVKKCDQYESPRRQLTVAQKRESKEWKYYIAAEEIFWDYAPDLPKHVDSSFEADFLTKSATRIGQKYKKVVYTLYSNASFTKPLESRQRRSELGILGPVIRAQIRDVVRIVFKNKASRPYSIYPHGLTIEKSEEGANYPAGGNQTHGVQPGETHTYLWRVIEEDEPLDGDSRCLTRMYHSAVDAPRDIASGLIGPILICKSQSLNIKNAQVRADKEQHAVFAVFDENKSWYLDDNIKLFSDPSRVSKEDSAFQKSNVMHTINGYMYEGGPTVGFCNGEVATWHVSSVGAQDYIQTVTFYGHPFEVNGRTEDFLSLYPMTGETIAMNMDNTGFWLLVSLNSHESTKGMRVKFQDVECYRESLYEYEERDFEVWTLPTSEDTEIKEEINVPKNPGKTETDMYTDMWADQLGIRSHKNQSRGASAEKIDLSFLDYDFKDVVSGATENNSQNTGDLQLQIVSSPRNNSSIGTRNDKSNVEVEPRALPTGASLPNHGSSNHTEFIDLSTLKQDGKNLTLRGQEKTNDTTVTQGATNLTLTLEDHSNVTLSTQQPVAQNYLTQESNNHTQDLRNLSLSTQHPTIPTQEPTNHTFSIQEQTNSTQDFTSLNLSAQNPTNTTQHPTNLTLSTKTPTYLNITAQKVTNITLQEEETEKLSLINLNDTLIGTANSNSNESSISNVTMPKIINPLALHNTTYLSSRDEVNLLLAKHNNVSIKTENGNLTKLENASVHITKPETDVVLAIPKNISLKNMEYNTSNMTSEPHLTNPAANILNISSILEMKGKHTLEQPEEKHTRGDVFLYTEPSKNLDTAVVHDTSDTLGVRHANDTSVLNNTITNQTSVNGSDFTHISLLDGIQSNDTLDEESNSLEDLPFFIDEPSPRNVSTNEVERGLSEEDSYSESKEEVIIYLKENQTEVIKSSSVNAKDHSWTYTGSHQTEVMEIPEDMVKYIGDKTFGEPKKKRKLKKINLRQRPEKGFGMKTKRRKEYKPQVKSGLPISPRGFNPIVNPRGSRPLLQQPVLDEEELLNTPVVIGVPRPDFSDYELYIPGEEPSHLEIDLTNTNANDYEFVSYKDPYSSQEDIQDLSLGEANEVSGLYDKIYYISAEEVDWDYAGFGQQRQEKSQPLNSRETKFTKVVFRGYLDSKFKIPDIRGEMDEHLGILGPPIKAEVGQTIMVVFRNNAHRPFSIHPNGVSYTKRTEGLSYEDGSNYLFQYDNEVKPNTTFGYVWKVSSKAGPSSEESKCRTWAYYSGVNPEKDIHSGLIGPLLVCRKGTLDKQVIDMREFTLLFMTFDESQSWYYDVNYQRTWRKSRRKMRDFHGENLKFRSINGITHNLKGLRMYTDQLVCWHLINMGSPKDFQSVHFHGQTFIHRKTNGYRQAVYPLLPGNFATLEMFPSKPGLWLLESEVGFNQQKGMQTLFLVLDNACYRALGLERRIVNDDKITAINTRDYWEPHLARLNNGGKYNAWSTEHNDSWIQVDFERPVVISQVAIQGAKQLFQSQFVVKFFISYSNDRRKWYYYKGDGHHLQKMFMGNQEAYVTKTNTFFPPLIGRFVRLHPVEWYNKATVRMEYYGCELDGCSVPLGMESRRIEDHRITASSTASSWTWEWKPSLARLNKKGTINAWQARFNDQNQWLQVELPEKKKITGIITQGAKTLMKEMYVISYTLQYSDDGLHWIHYTDDDGNLPKVLLGNTDNNEHAKNYIYPPIFSRFVRINPSSWMGAITMRIELLGCDFD